MGLVGTLVWLLAFVAAPVALVAAAVALMGNNPIVVFLALSWLVLGAVLYPFAMAHRA